MPERSLTPQQNRTSAEQEPDSLTSGDSGMANMNTFFEIFVENFLPYRITNQLNVTM